MLEEMNDISQVEQRFSQSGHLIAAKMNEVSLLPELVKSFWTSLTVVYKYGL